MSTSLTEGKSRKKSAWKNALTVLLFVLPALIPLIIFWIYPILRSVWLSFTNWDFMTPDYDVVGLKNYISLLKDSRFYNALWNTVVFTAGTLVPTIAGGLGLALLLRKNFRGSGIFKFVLFSPWITPTVAISIVWTWIFKADGGIANIVLGFFGLPALKWINSSSTAMLSVIIVTVWKSLGYAMIFYLSALEKVPAELYEASSLDGAKPLRQFLDMTLPSISPTTFFLMIITMVNSLQAYDQIQILTQGGPSGSTRTLLYMYYQLGFQEFKMGEATAIAVIMIIITVLLSLIQFTASKKWVHY
ncbi:MAG: sugar ABC transporter permease [Lachnospiraceae bacterium]|nr:sugar ABC transporter permease [Lachnospiraceae bacterium]